MAWPPPALRSAGARQVAITNNYAPAWPASGSEADRAAAHAYDILHNRLFTDPVLLGTYPDLSAFGLPHGLDCVKDGDLAAIAAPVDALGVNYYMPMRLVGAAGLDAAVPDGAHPRIPGDRLRLAGGPGRTDANC